MSRHSNLREAASQKERRRARPIAADLEIEQANRLTGRAERNDNLLECVSVLFGGAAILDGRCVSGSA